MRTLYGVAGLVLFSDQLTKFLALLFLKSKSSVPIVPNVFHLSFVENTGIAFGLFRDHPQFWTFLISASVLILLVASWFFKNQSFVKRMAFGFILGGAIGNCIDRIRFEHVIDFLDFRIWPVFNLADSFITVGVFLFIWVTLRAR
ncbi:MAG: signal peptidase II [Candidatus Omnitrophica bacterium]|nr:signal peptidase II [Candidatus Omnitrophota bacterium]